MKKPKVMISQLEVIPFILREPVPLPREGRDIIADTMDYWLNGILLEITQTKERKALFKTAKEMVALMRSDEPLTPEVRETTAYILERWVDMGTFEIGQAKARKDKK